jgi:hypothetical protein
MLNEVRRKPEKPRAYRQGIRWVCEGAGIKEYGTTPLRAITKWHEKQATPPNRA